MCILALLRLLHFSFCWGLVSYESKHPGRLSKKYRKCCHWVSIRQSHSQPFKAFKWALLSSLTWKLAPWFDGHSFSSKGWLFLLSLLLALVHPSPLWELPFLQTSLSGLTFLSAKEHIFRDTCLLFLICPSLSLGCRPGKQQALMSETGSQKTIFSEKQLGKRRGRAPDCEALGAAPGQGLLLSFLRLLLAEDL